MAEPSATVKVGQVRIEDELASFDSNETGGNSPNAPSIFGHYKCVNRYEKDGHKYMMGITSPNGFNGQSAAFVQLAAPTLLWICDWTALKFGTQPTIPNPNPADPNWILLDDSYEPVSITAIADGATPIYRISGTYVYGHKNPSSVTVRDIAFPRTPWLDDEFDRNMPEGNLKNYLSTKQLAHPDQAFNEFFTRG